MAEEAQERPASSIKEFSQFSMFTKFEDSQTRSSRLAWGYLEKDGRIYPRLTVFTNTKNDPVANGIISAGMDAETVIAFLTSFKEIAEGGNGTKAHVVCMTTSRDNAAGNGSAVGEKIHACDIFYGKDENGIVWISLIAKDRPRIKFEYRLSDFHEIYHGDGSPYTAAEASQAQALSTIKGMYDIYINALGTIRPTRPQGENRSSYSSNRPAQSDQQSKKADSLFDSDVF